MKSALPTVITEHIICMETDFIWLLYTWVLESRCKLKDQLYWVLRASLLPLIRCDTHLIATHFSQEKCVYIVFK